MPKVMPIYGTRPEAIKVAPIVKALQADDRFECVVTVTGQHREMLDQVNELFGIVPDHDLDGGRRRRLQPRHPRGPRRGGPAQLRHPLPVP